jgi:hypothetical protein
MVAPGSLPGVSTSEVNIGEIADNTGATGLGLNSTGGAATPNFIALGGAAVLVFLAPGVEAPATESTAAGLTMVNELDWARMSGATFSFMPSVTLNFPLLTGMACVICAEVSAQAETANKTILFIQQTPLLQLSE